MKRRGILIHQVHIADGFVNDCEELMHRWLKIDTHTYESFCEIWKDMQFGFLYHGRTSGTEMAELSEELLQVAKYYMVVNTSNFEESVAGVFLVYGVVNLQPYQGFAPLRIVPEDVPAINRIEAVARREKRYDLLYILGSLLIQGPVQYHVASRERGMDTSIRKYLEGYTSIDDMGVRPRGVFYRQNEELDLLREMNSMMRRYASAKEGISGLHKDGLSYTDVNFANDIEQSLKAIINGPKEQPEPETQASEESRYSRVQSVKNKAMRQPVDGLRFLQTTNDTTISAEESSQPEQPPASALRDPRAPRRKASPRKSLPGIRKRPKPKRHKRDSKGNTDSTDSESDLEESVSSGDSKAATDSENHRERLRSDLFIETESLPQTIETEQSGQQFQIELIDEVAGSSSEDSSSFGDYARPGTSSSGTRDGYVFKEDDDQNDLRLKKKDRSELKKTLLKSKFKRMGMLRVANFDDDTLQVDNKSK